MRILIAFDKFKDSLSAEEACNITEAVLRTLKPTASIINCPLTDGGEGFRSILTKQAQGRNTMHSVKGPRFQPMQAGIGIVKQVNLHDDARRLLNLPQAEEIAIIEMAEAAGLQQLSMDDRDCRKTTTYGVGQLLLLAKEAGVGGILLGLGGSATSDLGLGALESLGMRFYNKDQERLYDIVPEKWGEIARMEWPDDVSFPPLRIACDVNNPLLGAQGAAAIYGPQKGLPHDLVAAFDQSASAITRLFENHPQLHVSPKLKETPGMGAAGGIAYGLSAALGSDNVQIVQGYELVKSWLRLEEHLQQADLIITGEGKFDLSSLQGKGPGELVRKAHHLHRKVMVFAGRIEVPESQFEEETILVEISNRDAPLARELKNGPENLEKAVKTYFAL